MPLFKIDFPGITDKSLFVKTKFPLVKVKLPVDNVKAFAKVVNIDGVVAYDNPVVLVCRVLTVDL